MSEFVYAIAVVFLIGAAPWLEVWVAIPVGIAMGLNPVIAFAAAVTGNFVPLIAIVLTYRRAQTWFKGRFLPDPASSSSLGGRRRRFKKLWNRYGVPVVALVAPATIGTHLATILAMMGGSSRKSVLTWMALSLILWGAATSVASFYSIEYIRSIFW